jgi:uncharacterized protein GlcG (DUF336 family)
MRQHLLAPAALAVVLAVTVAACERGNGQNGRPAGQRAAGGCDDLPGADALREHLQAAAIKYGDAGGLNSGKFMWAAVVNRNGELCGTATSTDDRAAVWPGSRGIAIAKAFTANAFSTDTAPLSTARLYTLSQPGQSLWGAANGNPINPECLGSPENPDTGVGQVCGGTIVFGGGVPLYRGNRRVGGLGVSGDTSCADHEIAKRVREIAELVPDEGSSADDIVFATVDGPSVFAHPVCPNTIRNGQAIGDEQPRG